MFEAPRGRGPYGICTAPDESVYYASLAGNHLFAFRFLRQTMYGEESIKMKADAYDRRLARKKERDAAAGEPSGE